jgi:hypothetical protein
MKKMARKVWAMVTRRKHRPMDWTKKWAYARHVMSHYAQ